MAQRTDPRTLEYDLPPTVMSRMDWDYRGLSTVAVTAGLFAGVLMSLAQVVANNSAPDGLWEAVRFFYTPPSYRISSQPVAAAAQDHTSVPYMATDKQPLPEDWLESGYQLTEAFGANRGYSFEWQEGGAYIFYMLALILSFCAIITYVWAAESLKVAIALTIFAVPGFVVLLNPVYRLIRLMFIGAT